MEGKWVRLLIARSRGKERLERRETATAYSPDHPRTTPSDPHLKANAQLVQKYVEKICHVSRGLFGLSAKKRLFWDITSLVPFRLHTPQFGCTNDLKAPHFDDFGQNLRNKSINSLTKFRRFVGIRRERCANHANKANQARGGTTVHQALS